MINEILRIAGQEVDLIPKSIDRTIQINDLGSAESRESSYSQTISLPKTSRNQTVMNFLGVAGNMSRAPYVQLSCDYIVDGIPLIVNGYTEVKATKEYYEVVIYDGVIDFAEKLKGRTLNTLDYSDLNHYSSVENFVNSLSNTEGYIYAYADYGLNHYSPKVEQTVPSVFTHTLWDKIFSQLGINYHGNFFEQNEDFRTEVVTPPQGFEVIETAPTLNAIGSYNTTNEFYHDSSSDFIFNANKTFGFDTTFSDSRVSFGSNGVITFNTTGRIRLDIDLTYNTTSGYNVFRARFNEGTAKSIHLDPLQDSKTVELNLSVNSGDELYFEVNGSDTGFDSQSSGGTDNIGGEDEQVDSIEGHYSVHYSASASINFSEVTGGFLVDFNEIMGDLPQIDFVKDVMQRYGLVIKPVKGTDDYEFIQFENLLNDRKNADDWTDKLVDIEGEEYGIKYAKENKATYDYHEDIEVPTHDGVLSIDNENAEPEKSLFKSPYTIPTYKTKRRNEPFYIHPVWEYDEDDDGNRIVNVKEAPIKTFRIKRVEWNTSVYYFNDSNGTPISEMPFLSLENMSMQYFLNMYYKAYRFAVNTYKEVSASFYFNLLDIHELDLFKLKYLKQTGKFYYLNKLQHNAGGEVSKGKLIEINEFSYNLPVQTLGSYTLNMSYGSTRNLNLFYLTSYTTPRYVDPENDSPLAVKFISGFNNNIKLYQAGEEITDDTEIPVSEWDVTIEDLRTTTNSHQESFEYMIKDEGSETYGNQVGTFNVSVYEYTNQDPIANAGEDKRVAVLTDGSGNDKLITLDGSDSYDYSGEITSYVWEVTSKPYQSNPTILNSLTNETTATFSIPQERHSLGVYTVQLTVTDEFGATDTDTMTITIEDASFEPAPQ